MSQRRAAPERIDVVLAGVGDGGSSLLVILRKLAERLKPEGIDLQLWFVERDEQATAHGAVADRIVGHIEAKGKAKNKHQAYGYSRPFDANEVREYLRSRLFLFTAGKKALAARRGDGRTLATLLKARRLIVYLATPPQAYVAYLKEMAAYKARHARVAIDVALEKPLANSLPDLDRLCREVAKLEGRMQVVSIDHYLGKHALELLHEAFRSFRAFREDVQERALQLAVDFVENDLEIARARDYFLATGILKDMLPHALATVRSVLADPALVFDVGRWRWGSRVSRRGVAVPTFFEGELVAHSPVTPPRSVWVRLLKGPKGVAPRRRLLIGTGDPNPIAVDLANGKVEIGDGHAFTAQWDGEAGWENCLLRLVERDYQWFPEWSAAVSSMRTILSIDQDPQMKKLQLARPALAGSRIPSPLGLDWDKLRPQDRSYFFIHLNGWLIDSARFNRERVRQVCARLEVKRPPAIDGRQPLSLRELLVRIISLRGRDSWLDELGREENHLRQALLAYTSAEGKKLMVKDAARVLERVARDGMAPEARSRSRGLRIVVISNSRKEHVAAFLHGSGLAPHVHLATNREHFRHRDRELKEDLMSWLGISPERLVIVHDNDEQFIEGATNILGARNDMAHLLARLKSHGVLP